MSPAPSHGPEEWKEMVKVIVGPEEHEFQVHKHILDPIPFFDACLNRGFQESSTRTIKLPEDNVNAFSEMLRWVYGNSNCAQYGPYGLNPDLHIAWKVTGALGSVERYTQLSQLESQVELAISTYVLARKLDLEYLANDIMDALDRFKAENMTATHAELVYLFKTPCTEELLHDFILQSLVYSIRALGWPLWKAANIDSYERFLSGHPTNMEKVLSKLTSTSDLRPPSRLRNANGCAWHIHVKSGCIRSSGLNLPYIVAYPPPILALALRAPKQEDKDYPEYKRLLHEYISQGKGSVPGSDTIIIPNLPTFNAPPDYRAPLMTYSGGTITFRDADDDVEAASGECTLSLGDDTTPSQQANDTLHGDNKVLMDILQYRVRYAPI